MWGEASPLRGYTGPGCGRGGASAAKQLGAGRRCGILWSPLLGYPRGGSLRAPPWSYPLVLHGSKTSSARPGPRARLALVVPELPLPLPGANGPPSPRRRYRAPLQRSITGHSAQVRLPAWQAGKCSPALGSTRTETPLTPTARVCYAPSNIGICY